MGVKMLRKLYRTKSEAGVHIAKNVRSATCGSFLCSRFSPIDLFSLCIDLHPCAILPMHMPMSTMKITLLSMNSLEHTVQITKC